MVINLKIAAKRSVTLSKALLSQLGVAPGDRLVVDILAAGRVQIGAAKSPATIDNFIGCLSQPETPSLSIDEISQIAADGWTTGS